MRQPHQEPTATAAQPAGHYCMAPGSGWVRPGPPSGTPICPRFGNFLSYSSNCTAYKRICIALGSVPCRVGCRVMRGCKGFGKDFKFELIT